MARRIPAGAVASCRWKWFSRHDVDPASQNSRENVRVAVRYFEVAIQAFPDWGIHAPPVTVRSGQKTAKKGERK
jgi:hypothetical protein